MRNFSGQTGPERYMSEGNAIMVTRELTDGELELARSFGLEPVIEPAIRISFVDPPERVLHRASEGGPKTWAFTSRNGVKGYLRLLRRGQTPPKPPLIYAVGENTARALEEAGIEARHPDRQDAVGLAELILEQWEMTSRNKPAISGEAGNDLRGELLHWCGNRSRKELGEALRKGGVERLELQVYRTDLNRMRLPDRSIRALLFYSPSAVEAFRISGGFNTALPPLFAIGATTAEALAMESGENVQIPDRPSTPALLRLVASELNRSAEKSEHDPKK